jgi:hypothetical protein
MANLPAIIPPVERPLEYTQAIAEAICERLMNGELLIEICDDPAMPRRPTVYRWLVKYMQFANMYAHAREVQADYFADENVVIARTPQLGDVITKKGDGSVEIKRGDMLGHRQLNIDVRKWYASKLNRRVYGQQSPRDDDAEKSADEPPVTNEPPRV